MAAGFRLVKGVVDYQKGCVPTWGLVYRSLQALPTLQLQHPHFWAPGQKPRTQTQKQNGGDGPKLKTRWRRFAAVLKTRCRRCCRRDDWYIILKSLCFGFRVVEVGMFSGCSILLKSMCADVRIGLPEPPEKVMSWLSRSGSRYIVRVPLEVGLPFLKRFGSRWRPNSRCRLGFRLVEVCILSGWSIKVVGRCLRLGM